MIISVEVNVTGMSRLMKLWNSDRQDDADDSSSGWCNVHKGLLPVLQKATLPHPSYVVHLRPHVLNTPQWMRSNLLGILSENPPIDFTAQELKVKNIKTCVCPQRFEMTHSHPSFDASAHAHRHKLLLSITSNTFSTFPNTDKTTQHSSSLKGISLL